MRSRTPAALAPLLAAAALTCAAGAAAPAGAQTGSLRQWLQHLHFDAPAISLDMGSLSVNASELAFEGGNCTALDVGSVRVQDSSSGPTLLWSVNVSSVGLRCTLKSSSPALSADVALRDSWVAASLAVQSFDFSGKPLPVAAMMSGCSSGLQVSDLHFKGSPELSAELNADRSAAAHQLREALNDMLCVRMPSIVTTAGSNMLKNIAMILAELMQPPPVPELPRAAAPLVDWGAYPPVLLGKAMLAERFARWQASRTSGKDFVKLGLDMDFRAPGDVDLGLGLGALELAGIDTLRAPGLALSGDGNGTLELDAAARQLSLTVMGQLGVAPLQQQMPGLTQTWNLTVGLSDLSVAVGAVAMLSEPMFESLKVSQLQSIGCVVGCARAAADPAEGSVGLRKLAVKASSLKLSVGASGTLEEEAATLVDALVGSFLKGYWQSLVLILNSFSTFWFSSLTDKLWTHLDEAAHTCEGPTGVEGVVGDSALTGLWGTSVALAFAGVVAGILACVVPCGSGDRSAAQAAHSSERFHNDPEAGSSSTVPSEEESSSRDACLAASVPQPLAVFFPFAVFSVMFLFFFADLDLGTSVDLHIASGGRSTTFGSLFSFSLIGTIRSTWEAEAYAISVLTLLFSGVWPLAKLVLLLVAWLAPPRRIGLATRGRLLSFLDVWGKYSFLDSWFLVLCMSAFSMEWQGGGASLRVRTRPTAAYFAFLFATILSLLLGNVASYFHRQAEAKSAAEGSAASARAAAARGRGLRQALGREGRSLAVHLFVGAALILSVVVTLCGVAVTSFEFGMSGLGADIIFQEQRHTESYGLLTVGAAVSDAVPGSAGLRVLEAVFLLISFVVPLLLLLALAFLWLVPLKADQQDTLLHACHVLDTWSALDVFVLAILAGHAEFGQLAGRLLSTGSLKAVCVPLEEKLGMQCMSLDLGLLPGFALLSAAGILALVVPKSVHQLCMASAEAREAKFKMDDQAVAGQGVGARAEGRQQEVRVGNEAPPSDGAESLPAEEERRGEAAVAPSDARGIGGDSQHAAL